MVYETIFTAKDLSDGNFDITYCVINDKNSYFIESYICGSDKHESSFLGSCGKEKAKNLAHTLAEKAVRPIHIEDIISDLRF